MPSSKQSTLRSFVDRNTDWSQAVNRAWPYRMHGIWDAYARRVAVEVNGRTDAVVMDVGAGRETPFAPLLTQRAHIIGVDLLAEDMNENRDLDERVVADVGGEGLPSSRAVDVVCSRMVLEHLEDVEEFVKCVYAALKPGGVTIHLFAGRYAPFALANRLLPDALSKRVLYALKPSSVDVGGFPAHYDRTDPDSVRVLFERAGLEVRDIRVSYDVTPYFEFFVPLFLLGRLWENLMTRLKLQRFASFVLIVASRSA